MGVKAPDLSHKTAYNEASVTKSLAPASAGAGNFGNLFLSFIRGSLQSFLPAFSKTNGYAKMDMQDFKMKNVFNPASLWL